MQTDNYKTPEKTDELWRSLHIFNLYRLTVVGIITVTFFSTTIGTTAFGLGSPTLFGISIVLWLSLVFISGFASRLRKPGFHWQAYTLISTDIIFITILIYASGGVTSGLGALMMVTIAASGILLSGKISFAFAAFATLAIFSSQGYRLLSDLELLTQTYVQNGLLGAGLFAVALLAHLLTLRVQTSEALAEKQKKELLDLEQINELIIQQMQTGILLIDSSNNIKLMNKFTNRLFSSTEDYTDKNISELSTELLHQLQDWRKNPYHEVNPILIATGGNELLPRFTHLRGESDLSTLIFLDDAAQFSKQAQQAKLASLGRLTASIAHEIRNPLSAISHASQLLDESDHLPAEDHRLTEIIEQQTHRLNVIVENILSLSRKKKFKPEPVEIVSWLKSFHENLLIEQGLNAENIRLEVPDRKIMVTIDKTHLSQIMCNLSNNGIRHSKTNQANVLLDIRCSNSADNMQTYIDVTDYGTGVQKEHQEKLFEPFFTTESTGTGLGLFIARELSQLNNAYIRYTDSSDTGDGAQFRISFTNA